MARFNSVTEKAAIGPSLWLVSAEWRGGHDRRVFRLSNLHETEAAAKADWDRLTVENHRKSYGQPEDFDPGFARLPLRKFQEVQP